MDCRTNVLPTDGQTDTASYRGALAHIENPLSINYYDRDYMTMFPEVFDGIQNASNSDVYDEDVIWPG